MSALFRPRSNTTFRFVLLAIAVAAVGIPGALMAWPFSPIQTGRFQPVLQPIQFDHRHHVVDDGIDCRYCHETAETGPSAGIPATSVCLGCHSQIWNKSPLLDRVRQSGFTGRPLRWVRVHKVPDCVYFDHSIHVAKGVGCSSCHGRVDLMPAVEQVAPLTMGWCLSCHRDPGPHLRPRDRITDMTWTPPDDGGGLARKLLKENDVHARTSCTTCHR
jgi:hypothetical protein